MSGVIGDNVYRASGVIAAAAAAGGAIDWQTDSIKTTGFTATAGEGYFCNTTAGAFTLTLPSSPTAGDMVALEDYANTFDTNALTIGRGGSDIGGVAADAVISEEGIAVTAIYIDATQGWKVTNSGLMSEMPPPAYVAGCGGTETTAPCGNYKVHSFTGPGTFTVTCGGNAAGSNSVEWMAVAGGAGGGLGVANTYTSGGGGAGGMRYSYPSPVSGGAPVSASPGAYTIVVGGGGANGPGGGNPGNVGSDSSAIGFTSAGGGFGASGPGGNPATGQAGGSGGGGGAAGTGGAGNTPSTTPAQGNAGGTGCGSASPGRNAGGGGGGHGGCGAVAVSSSVGGLGGIGTPLAIGDSPALPGGRTYAGGANGSQGSGCACAGGAPGGGGYDTSASSNKCGIVNTGGGGSGGWPACYGDGGSGIVILRYKFQ